MTLMMELKEQRREGYDEGYGEGFDKATIKMVRSLVEKKGWDYKEAFDFFDVSPENRLAIEQSFKQN